QSRTAAPSVATRVARVAELLDLGPMLGQPAGRLSVADRQTVAIGRALCRDDLAAVLLDDPFAAIEPADRPVLRRRIRRAQSVLGRTFVYAIPEPADALAVADDVLVFDGGRLLQAATPEVLIDLPATPQVGLATGSDGMNLIP